MRASTWDLVEGFDKIRWDDDRDTLLTLYPTAGARRERVGINPQTGESVVMNAGLHVADRNFAVPVDPNGINLYLSIGLDGGVVSDITLASDGGDDRHTDASPEEWMNVLRRYAQKMAEALGIEPFDPDEMEQSWEVNGVRIELLLEWDAFAFTFQSRS